MTFSQIDFYIIEDEQIARDSLIEALNGYNQVKVVGYADNVPEAYTGIIETQPDALFLDIKLRGGNGFHLLRKFQDNHLQAPPAIIMTGHDEFELAQEAINHYRGQILKILKKPFWNDFDHHFQQCRDAIFAYRRAIKEKSDPEVFFVKDGAITYRLEYKEIDFIEVGGSGTIFLSTSPRLQESKKINITLSKFLDQAPDRFIRVHRNYAVQIAKISHINHEEHMLYLLGQERGIPIGRTYYPVLNRLFNQD